VHWAGVENGELRVRLARSSPQGTPVGLAVRLGVDDDVPEGVSHHVHLSFSPDSRYLMVQTPKRLCLWGFNPTPGPHEGLQELKGCRWTAHSWEGSAAWRIESGTQEDVAISILEHIQGDGMAARSFFGRHEVDDGYGVASPLQDIACNAVPPISEDLKRARTAWERRLGVRLKDPQTTPETEGAPDESPP
jgi:hypothetical protein